MSDRLDSVQTVQCRPGRVVIETATGKPTGSDVLLCMVLRYASTTESNRHWPAGSTHQFRLVKAL